MQDQRATENVGVPLPPLRRRPHSLRGRGEWLGYHQLQKVRLALSSQTPFAIQPKENEGPVCALNADLIGAFGIQISKCDRLVIDSIMIIQAATDTWDYGKP